jgi:hypothetical protein
MQQCTLKIDADKHCEQAIFLIHYDLWAHGPTEQRWTA